jgi:outer membrane protein assembly factor BamE (lipoprotein component of BamABCDE complex)
MICKKCGKEVDGEFCSNCGSRLKEKEPRKKLTKKQIMSIVIPIVVVAVLIAIIVPSAIASSNIFRVGKVDKINIGDSREKVLKILGEPYEQSDFRFEYYSKDYLKLAKQIDDYYNSDLDIDEDFDMDQDIEDFDPDKDLNWDDEDKITKMEEELENMVYKYIVVDFDSKGKVESVFFDAEKCDSKDYKKVVKNYKLVTKEVTRYSATDIIYSVKLTDGSFYKSIALTDYITFSSSNASVEWSDEWKSDYKGEIRTKDNPDILYAAYCGKNVWYELHANGELKILGNGIITKQIDNKDGHTVIIGKGIMLREDLYNGFSKMLSNPKEITKIVFEENSQLTNIGYAFYGCSSLVSIEIPSSVISIGDGAFYGCSSLTSIEIPSSITSIGDYAFYGCSSLTSIEIPSSVTSMGDGAFAGCSNLASIVIPSSVTSIGWQTFSGCSGLTIYCEAESQPSGWDSRWNFDNRPVIWGYKK